MIQHARSPFGSWELKSDSSGNWSMMRKGSSGGSGTGKGCQKGKERKRRKC
jgi:hypothetical protein